MENHSKNSQDVIKKAKRLKGEILSIGITNQRETTVLWIRKQENLFIKLCLAR